MMGGFRPVVNDREGERQNQQKTEQWNHTHTIVERNKYTVCILVPVAK